MATHLGDGDRRDGEACLKSQAGKQGCAAAFEGKKDDVPASAVSSHAHAPAPDKEHLIGKLLFFPPTPVTDTEEC